jgi:hypothetical protein
VQPGVLRLERVRSRINDRRDEQQPGGERFILRSLDIRSPGNGDGPASPGMRTRRW